MSHQTPIVFKLGRSMWLGIAVRDEAGDLADLTLVEPTCVARDDAGRKKADMLIEWIDRANGSFEVWPPGNGTSEGWTPGAYTLAIVYTKPNGATGGRPLVVGTEDILITLER